MSLRGDDARERALARLNDRQAAVDAAVALHAPRESNAMQARALASIVRVSLLETSEGFSSWVHTTEALRASEEFVRTAAQEMNDRGLDWFEPPRPQAARTTAGGHVAAASWDGRILKEVGIAWDRGGIGGVRFAGSRPDDSGVYYLLSVEARDGWVRTAVRYLLTSFLQAGAFGPAVVRWDLYGIRGADVKTLRDGNVVAAQGVIPQHYNNMVALDTDIDLGETTAENAATDLWQQLERLAGAQRH